MLFKVGIGRSVSRDSTRAGEEAALQALEALEGAEANIVIVFATTGYSQPDLIGAIYRCTGPVPMTGCSAEGVITKEGSNEESHVVAVMAIASDQIKFRNYLVPNVSADARKCGLALAESIQRDGAKTDLLLVFPDGITANSSELLNTLETALTSKLAIAGGTAGELMTFQRTYQYYNGEVVSDAVAALAIGGPLNVELAVSHGCDLLGIEQTITKSKGSLVYEIDGQPAWSAFKEFLSEGVTTLDPVSVSYLAIAEKLPQSDSEYGDYAIRVPLRLESETDALFFGTTFAEGTKVQMALRNADRISERAITAAQQIAARHPQQQPLLVLQFDCAGRGQLLYGPKTTQRLIRPVQQQFSPDVPWLGFHSYGEIAPAGGRTLFHNYTAVICAWYP